MGRLRIVSFGIAIILAGCDGQALPEVNEENCKVGNILSIDNVSLREKLSKRCAEHTNPRTGEFKTSPKKEW